MKFALDEKVRIIKTGEIGEVTMLKYELSINHRDRVESNKYLIKTPHGYVQAWYKEEELEYLYKFSDKFELGFLDLQMNINLSLKNYDMCKYLHKQKQTLKKEGK